MTQSMTQAISIKVGFLEARVLARQWWFKPIIPVLGGRVRWISEFDASLIYREISRTARTTQRNPVSKKKQKQKTKQTNK